MRHDATPSAVQQRSSSEARKKVFRLLLYLLIVCFVGWLVRNMMGYYPFRTAAPVWGQISQIPSSLSPKRDCGPKGIKHVFDRVIRPRISLGKLPMRGSGRLLDRKSWDRKGSWYGHLEKMDNGKLLGVRDVGVLVCVNANSGLLLDQPLVSNTSIIIIRQ